MLKLLLNQSLLRLTESVIVEALPQPFLDPMAQAKGLRKGFGH
jgi:hypothetical protein